MKEEKKRTHGVLFIFLFILIGYSNTFQSSWQFDDEPNILLNSNLHISELTVEQMSQAMRARPFSPESGKLYRPLPCLTFGLNWYLGQDNVWGYHAVNTAVHILTAWLLFLTLRLLLRIYYQKKENSPLIDAAALLGALFWALAPIQTQAITYIVQRMASMAAMFGIGAIYAYLMGKLADSSKGKIVWFLLCFLSFLAALGSKENAIMLLPSLALVEFSFFKHQITRQQVIRFALAAASILITAAFFVHPLNFLEDYNDRSFTLSQRILSQPRILLMYISQIFFPSAGRLSFEHEIILSTSIFSPWTTLPAIAVILGMIGSSFVFLKKQPLICFPVLFYFLNHAVESTILPLELFFEHRNYLPSLFLFLPFGVLAAHILYGAPHGSALRKVIAATCATLFLIISGCATYTRNEVWATEGTLWTDAIKKAPNSARAARYLGKWHQQRGEDEIAYRYLQSSLANAKNDPRPEYAKTTALNQIGALYYDRHENEKALYYLNKCLDSDEYSEPCLRNRVLVFLSLKQPKQALNDAELLIKQYPSSVAYRYLAALSFYKAEDFDASLKTISSIDRPLDDYQIMQLTGLIFLKKHNYKNSLFFLEIAERLFPSLENKIYLAAVYYLLGQKNSYKRVLHVIVDNYTKENINDVLNENYYNILTPNMKNHLMITLKGY